MDKHDEAKRNAQHAYMALGFLLAFSLLIIGLWLFNMPVFASTYNDTAARNMLSSVKGGSGAYELSASDLLASITGEDIGYAEDDFFADLDQDGSESDVIGLEGIIRIPKIALEMPLLAGASTRNLRYSICYDTNSTPIGRKGNFVVFGHRMKKYGRHFNRLNEVTYGDEIHILIGDTEYVYTVDDLRTQLPPSEMRVLLGLNNAGRRISLITCTPIGKGTFRLVVMGELTATNPIGTTVGNPTEIPLIDEGDDASGSFDELE